MPQGKAKSDRSGMQSTGCFSARTCLMDLAGSLVHGSSRNALVGCAEVAGQDKVVESMHLHVKGRNLVTNGPHFCFITTAIDKYNVVAYTPPKHTLRDGGMDFFCSSVGAGFA